MGKIVIDIPELYDPNQAAEALGIGYATVFRWIKAGTLIPIWIGGRTLIPQSEIKRLKQEINKQAAQGRQVDDPNSVNQTRAAEILGISRMTIWQWLKEGKIQAVIVGGLRMIPQSEIKRLKQEINKQATGSAA